MKKYFFPEITKVTLENFSLYRKLNTITINLDKGVFCLAGANGLGKSTFLNILNYALTGIVKRPDSLFSTYGSIPQFYSKSKTFASTYFDKRIDENYREGSSVTIEFSINDTYFKLTRQFFEQDSLENLEVFQNGNNIVDKNDKTPSDLEKIYKSLLVKEIGLDDFDQYVFLQIYVFTFDETHQLLFWDNSLMERVLYLFFNLDPSKAKLADNLRKEVTTLESNMRNLQWDATQKQKELTNLLNQTKKEDSPEVNENELNDYKELASQLSEKLELIQRIDSEVKECDLLLSDYSLKISASQNDYNQIFNSSFADGIAIEKDPEIINFLNKFKNNVCSDTDTDDIIAELKKFIKLNKCKKNTHGNNSDAINNLKDIDEKLYLLNQEMSKIQKRKDRILNDYKIEREEANNIKIELDKIENNNENFLFALYKKNANSDLDTLEVTIKKQIDDILEKKKEEGLKRDQKKSELKSLEKDLNKQYLEAEETFMPMFINYAKSFLGLDINIYLQTYSKGATLILEVNNTERRERFQLSESQRYFLDIALRMALIEYSSQKAILLIDTPEGSLDIAYESKAGKMFADFVSKNYSLFITANINSSMLLTQLAKQCGAKNMKLERMTEWTTLSEVQQEEHLIIENAFNDIESHLV